MESNQKSDNNINNNPENRGVIPRSVEYILTKTK